MHTEKEASEKWCPMVRGSYSVPATEAHHGLCGNRDVNGGSIPNCNCIASRCMMWDWGGIRMPDGSHNTSAKAAGAAEFGQLNPSEQAIGDCARKRPAR